MFAVIKTGGKQYRVAEDQLLQIEKIKGEPGEIVQIGEVIMLGGEQPEFGSPMVAGASVAVEVLSQGRGPKVIAFKKRRRKNSRRKRGHRQEFTLIRISEILTGGAKPSKGPKPKSGPKTESAAAAAEARAGDEKPTARKKPSRKPRAAAKKRTGKKK
jgi:large subunit ribosomal protein L21